jgi:hypothetical protein
LSWDSFCKSETTLACAVFKWAVLAGQEFIIIPFNASDLKKLQRIRLDSVRSIDLDSSSQVSFADEQISKRTAKISMCYTDIELQELKRQGSSSPTRSFFRSVSGISSPLNARKKSKGLHSLDS